MRGIQLVFPGFEDCERDHELRNSETGNGLWLISQEEIEGLSPTTTRN